MKKLYLIFLSICLFSFTSIVNADTCVRDATNNYGVNKKWNMTSNRIKHANSTPCVDASEKIYDFSNLLSDEEKKSLKQKMQEFELLTNMDIVFVSTDFYYSSDSKNEDYAADFYDYNDFGLKYDHYSGVLLLRNTYSENPYFNIYTFGSAQLYFSYNRLENILDRIYPYFKNDVSYYNGINIFIDDLADYYNSGISEKYGACIRRKRPYRLYEVVRQIFESRRVHRQAPFRGKRVYARKLAQKSKGSCRTVR